MQEPAFLDDALTHWATTSPDATALHFVGAATSYGALEKAADHLAAHLISLGVSRGDRVVVYAAKSPNVIAAVYAIIRIGAIYVPLDPSAPQERLNTLIAATTPAALMADPARVTLLATQHTSMKRVNLESELPEPASPDVVRARALERSSDDPAYILMTSGSTGTPKGICHTHKSGLAYAQMAAKRCDLTQTDRVSHHTPLHFDMSIFDVFSTALAGAMCVIIPEMYAKIPASLAKLVQDARITVWYSVPYALIQMTERGALDTRDFSALRIIMLAGERIPPAALKTFSHHAPNATFLNAYGPTETNHCTTATFTHDALDGITPLSIGRPDDGVIARIGEGFLEDETGELLIASEQVMRGYWNDPVRTDAAFTILTSADGETRKYYRTGDLVSRDKAGNLVLLGRMDRQIKLRGYRIELDEIEHVLGRAPNVTEAAVIVKDDALYGFVCGPADLDITALNAYAAAHLPAYAVPACITGLTQLDRTSTGKIDRNALATRRHDIATA